MIIKYVCGVNLIKIYIFQVINNPTWIKKLDTSATLVN